MHGCRKKRIPRTQKGLALPCGDDNAPLSPRAELRLSTDSETVRNVCPAAKCNHGAWDLGQLRACWGQLTWIMVNARGPDRKGSFGASRDRICTKAHAGYGSQLSPRRAEYVYCRAFLHRKSQVSLSVSPTVDRFKSESWIVISVNTQIDRISLKE